MQLITATFQNLRELYDHARTQAGFRIGVAEGELDWPVLHPAITALAGRLRAAGVETGQTVIYQGAQGPDAFVLFWATVLTGAAFAPVDAGWPEFQLRQAAGRLNPRVVAGETEALERLRRVFPAAHPLAVPLDDDDSPGAPAAFASLPPGSPAAYLFTSGSTGTPKAVQLSHAALAHGGALTLETFAWRPGDRLLNLPEPHTMSGLRNAFVAAPLGGLAWSPLAAGGSLFDLIDAIAGSRCARLVCGPALLRHLALFGDRLPVEGFPGLKAIYCTGARLGPQDAAAVAARLGVPVVNYYGLTETGGLCISQSPEAWTPGDDTLGVPVGCEAAIADDGELRIRSPQLMTGYLGDPAATAARFAEGGWLRTGDLARRTSDGRIQLVGRADHFIKTASTERVHPEEIELVLEQHEAVAEAAVCGAIDTQGQERLCALVVLRPSASASPRDLAGFVTGRLGPTRSPRDIRFVNRLPRSGNGKLFRNALPEHFQ